MGFSALAAQTHEQEGVEPGVIPVVRRRQRSSLSRVGWLPKGQMAYGEWEEQGRWLGSIGRCSQWWIGDWVRFGTTAYGEKYMRASELTGYDQHSLRNIAYVASRFPELSRRRDNLSFSHHAELAPLEPREQERWLMRAERERLSVSALRRELRRRREQAAEQDEQEPEQPEPDPRMHPGDEEVLCCPNCGHVIDTRKSTR